MAFDLAIYLSLAAGGLWALIGLFPWLRRTLRSPGMWAFQFFGMSLGLAAFLVLPSRTASTIAAAMGWIAARDGATAAAALFFLFFCRWLSVRRRRRDVLFGVPTAVLVVLAWTSLTRVVDAPGEGLVLVREPLMHAVWTAYLLAYSAAGLAYLFRGASLLRRGFRAEYLRVHTIAATLGLALVGGFLGEAGLTLLGGGLHPILPALLLLAGVAFAAITLPIDAEWLSSLLRRLAASRQDILQAFLVYRGGTLIASRSRKGKPSVDSDVFTAVLEALQQFMHRSFPLLGPGWLGAIDHGDVKILVERGEYCFLALVTAGPEHDILRGEMRDALSRFEARNRAALASWDGRPDSLQGAEECLDFFLALHQVF